MQGHFLIMYDVADGKRLRKLAQWLENYAWRIQKSVFVAEADETLLDKIVRGIKRYIDKDEDSVYLFPICEKDWKKRECYGVSEEVSRYENSAVVL